MQVILGMISISDNADEAAGQISMHSGEFPPVTMTKQIGLMLHGEHPQAFVITRKGLCKHWHLVEMLERQVLKCFRIDNSVQAPAPPPPVPPSPVPTQPPTTADQPPPVLPSPVPTQPPATADQPCTNPAYFVRHFHVGENLIKVYIPSAYPLSHTRRAVLYLAGTTCEEAPIRAFHGSEIVYAPQFTNHGRYPWKNGVPDWLLNWVAEAQVDDASCRWSLFGFSRGAAWGAILAADVRLTFHRVLLVAPYVLPSCSDSDRHKLTVNLPMYRRGAGGPGFRDDLCIASGSEDPWPPCVFFLPTIQQTCRSIVFEGVGHPASLAKGVELWNNLLF